MRRIVWTLLLLFAFMVPWEYSLDFGEPWGNVARIVGLVLLVVAIPAALAKGRLKIPGAVMWLALALLLWLCCTAFWTVDAQATGEHLRGYLQEITVVWVIWEFAESPADLRALLRATLAGLSVLAVLTLADAFSVEAVQGVQIRFAAAGQDPNDVARFLDFGFPVAAYLLDTDGEWVGRLMALIYLPLGITAVLLTASRGGFVAALVALAGCGFVLLRNYLRAVLLGGLVLPVVSASVWLMVPHATLERLGTIPDQLQGGDLNQRLNIWEAGWRAFAQAPFVGHGAGSFIAATGLATGDTAHNTALSLLVEGGVIALCLAAALVVVLVGDALQTRGSLRIALCSLLAVWLVSSIVGTLAESRMTWLLFGTIALAGRLAAESNAEWTAFSRSSRTVLSMSLNQRWRWVAGRAVSAAIAPLASWIPHGTGRSPER